ncbi:MAG: tetratricopeptide repeat protein [Candidatus Eisenbacteria bacterium]|nr:tetratricopeptide repeat protein [Candidatus Eisenbacteria bacterium]
MRANRLLVVLALAAVTAAGCARVGEVGTRFRVEREYWRARRALSDLETRKTPVSREDLEKLRGMFLKVMATGGAATDPAVRQVRGASLLRDYDLLVSMRRGDEAAAALDRILTEFATDDLVAGEGLYRRSQRMMAAGDTAGGMLDLREVIRRVPPQLAAAGSVQAQVLGLPYDIFQYRLRREGRLAGTEEAQGALSYYYGIAARAPRSAEGFKARLIAANVFGELGNTTVALSVLDSLQQECRRSPELGLQRQDLLYRLARLNGFGLGEVERSHRYLDELARDFPKSEARGPAQLMRGELFARQKRNQEASRVFKAVAEDASLKEQTRAAAWLEMAQLADAQNNWEDAERCFREATANFPLTSEGLAAPLMVAGHYHNAKDAAGVKKALLAARKTYESILQRYPDAPVNLQVRQRLAETCARLEDWPAVAAAFGQMAERAQDPGTALMLMGRLAQVQEKKLNDRKAAADTYRRILAKFPKASFRAQVEAEIRRLGG